MTEEDKHQETDEEKSKEENIVLEGEGKCGG